MVLGWKDNEYKGFNNFKDAREWLSNVGHDTFHFCQGLVDGPKSKTDEHSGQPECYVVSNGRDAAIYERYRYDYLQCLESLGCETRTDKNQTQAT